MEQQVKEEEPSSKNTLVGQWIFKVGDTSDVLKAISPSSEQSSLLTQTYGTGTFLRNLRAWHSLPWPTPCGFKRITTEPRYVRAMGPQALGIAPGQREAFGQVVKEISRPRWCHISKLSFHVHVNAQLDQTHSISSQPIPRCQANSGLYTCFCSLIFIQPQPVMPCFSAASSNIL